jgi:hypothetical protein
MEKTQSSKDVESKVGTSAVRKHAIESLSNRDKVDVLELLEILVWEHAVIVFDEELFHSFPDRTDSERFDIRTQRHKQCRCRKSEC